MDKKVDNKAEELRGKAKEGVGRVAGDQELENQGKADQVKIVGYDAIDPALQAVKDGKMSATVAPSSDNVTRRVTSSPQIGLT